MKASGYVFLKVNTREPDMFVRTGNKLLCILRVCLLVKKNSTSTTERLCILGNLVVLGRVWVEVIFSIKLAEGSNCTSKHETSKDGHSKGLLIHHREGTWQTKAHGAKVGVWLGSKSHWAGAEHLRVRLELDVDLKSNRGDVWGRHASLLWSCLWS